MHTHPLMQQAASGATSPPPHFPYMALHLPPSRSFSIFVMSLTCCATMSCSFFLAAAALAAAVALSSAAACSAFLACKTWRAAFPLLIAWTASPSAWLASTVALAAAFSASCAASSASSACGFVSWARSAAAATSEAAFSGLHFIPPPGASHWLYNCDWTMQAHPAWHLVVPVHSEPPHCLKGLAGASEISSRPSEVTTCLCPRAVHAATTSTAAPTEIMPRASR
mmetsp:Transcript_64011/g.206208  ORF Transcript_64011/g.206208 Transcript_64011/m.206208 type:complete len:225 (+) Transcript_64011:628-1302(+)